jgi:glutaredoxin-like protein NrdH
MSPRSTSIPSTIPSSFSSGVTVYSKPNCPQCTLTCRVLDDKGVSYRKIDVSQDPEALDYVYSLGYRAAPVVVVNADRHWSGFRLDELNSLSAMAEAA